MIKGSTCYKNLNNPKCIDLRLTNKNRSFQNSCVIETGLSDFHKMTFSVLKCYFAKAESKVIFYRDYKNFSNESFKSLISYKNGNLQDHNVLDSFLDISKYALDKTALLKQKYIRANNSPFMNKTISRKIMKRTRMRNKFLRERTEANRMAYNIQRNYCVSLIRKTKRDYYSNLNHKQLTDNKNFWKTVKPFFTDKGVNNEKITLTENGETLSTTFFRIY